MAFSGLSTQIRFRINARFSQRGHFKMTKIVQNILKWDVTLWENFVHSATFVCCYPILTLPPLVIQSFWQEFGSQPSHLIWWIKDQKSLFQKYIIHKIERLSFAGIFLDKNLEEYNIRVVGVGPERHHCNSYVQLSWNYYYFIQKLYFDDEMKNLWTV